MKLKWKPTVDSSVDICVDDHTPIVAALAEVGYTLPCTLYDDALPLLRGMAATAAKPEAYKELIDHIIQHDSIDLWIE